jgi:lipopolysaccharide biosynthesis regulator YciM
VIAPEKHLAYALGFLQLGLHADAHAELAALPPEIAATAPALRVRLELAMAEEEWDRVIALAPDLVALDSAEERPWVAWAYALRELKRINEAQEILLAGVRMIGEPSPLVEYNLACYACLLGELEEAKQLLAHVYARDKSWRAVAREDPDLAALYPAKN